MSNIKLIIEERPSNIGNFMVGRLLPFREKRMIGPFAFIDHMGPTCLSDHENLDVPPHPHIGLSTLTYLFEGSVKVNDIKNISTDHFALFENEGEEFTIEATENTVVLVLSGEPIEEPIVAHGPFVMNTQTEIMQAFYDMNIGKFGYLED